MAESLTFLMHRVIGSMDQYADHYLHENFDISYRRFYVLVALSKLQPVIQHDLARCLGYSDAAVSRMVGVLCADGLASQQVDPSHGRRRLVTLTATGQDMLDRAASELEEEFVTLFESPEQTDELRRNMDFLQQQLANKLEEHL